MTDGNKVLLEIQNRIALLTLNKPGRLNTLDVGLWEELKSAAEVLLSEDARIGRSAAAQRIEPSFKGR